MIFSVKIPFSLEVGGWVIGPDLQEEIRDATTQWRQGAVVIHRSISWLSLACFNSKLTDHKSCRIMVTRAQTPQEW